MTVALPHIRSLTGTAGGPVLALLGAVHGNELVGVLAINAVTAELDPAELRGEVRWAAPAHPAAWEANTRVSPVDGLNLAREFPGEHGGRPTQRVAAHLTAELLTGSDALIDLHTAGAASDMPLLCGYESTGPLAAGNAVIAAAFAAPITWLHPTLAPGRSLAAAARLGIPSVYVETTGGNRIRERDLQFYAHGVRRVMCHLGMIEPPSGTATGGAGVEVMGDGNTDEGITSPVDGLFVTSVEAGQPIAVGEMIGRVADEQANTLAEIRSDVDGRVMLLQQHARVRRGDTLAIVAGYSTGRGEQW